MPNLNDTKYGLTAQRLRELLTYDPVTGDFRWRINRGPARLGCVAGCRTKNGYISICVDVAKYQAHRLAWLHSHGTWPKGHLDHVNGNRADNRLSNLREATIGENNTNRRGATRMNKLGVRGVYRLPYGKYRARVQHQGRTIHIGCFDTIEEASDACAEVRARLFGRYAGGV